MTWKIAGHEWAADLLKSHLAQGDMRHAYLFCGPPGVGRRTLALQFAQAVNCQNPPAPGEFCGECRACRQINAMQHSDLSVIQSEKEGGMLKVEQIRELQRSLVLSPYEARYRIALLLRFHEANSNAQNALLKTLEEAPAKVILLVTADSPENLLPTIVSRCEVLRLRPMSLERLQKELQNRGVDQEDARLLAHLSTGRLGYALYLQNDPARLGHRQTLMEDLLHMLTEPRRGRFTYADQMTRDKEALREAYRIWLSFWRDVMLCCATRDRSDATLPLVNQDMQAEIKMVASNTDLANARQRIVDLEQAIARLDNNVNARLLTEVLLMDWPYMNLV